MDLFDKRSVKEKLYQWMQTRQWTRTSDVLRWGTENYSTTAERQARTLAREGKIRRMTDEEKHRIIGFSKEDIWVLNAKN